MTSLAKRRDSDVLGFVAAALSRLTPRFALGAAAIGTALWLICTTNWAETYTRSRDEWLAWLLMAAALTTSMTIGLVAADEAVDRGASRFATYATAVVIAAAAGSVLQFIACNALGLPVWGQGKRWEIAYTEPAYVFFQTLNFGGLAVFVYANLRAAIAAAHTRNAAELARGWARRQTIESQLQAMQARVEPQFFCNTLAQLRALYAEDAERGARMLDDLITYLRSALPHLRESSSTLGKELELAGAYLNIMKVRIGDALSFSVQAPAAIVDARIPPMLLLPLINHALAQHVASANVPRTLSFAADAADGRLKISLTDSTGGLANAADSLQATPLSTVESRVAALYGDHGSFRITRTADGGACATLEVPHEVADDDHR